MSSATRNGPAHSRRPALMATRNRLMGLPTARISREAVPLARLMLGADPCSPRHARMSPRGDLLFEFECPHKVEQFFRLAGRNFRLAARGRCRERLGHGVSAVASLYAVVPAAELAEVTEAVRAALAGRRRLRQESLTRREGPARR